MTPSAETTDVPMLCPRCHTVYRRSGENCPRCHQDLAWLGRQQEVRSFLDAWATSDAVHLEVVLRWPGGSDECRRREGGQFELAAGPAGTLQLNWERGASELTVCGAGAEQTVTLPGAAQLHGVSLSVRLMALPQATRQDWSISLEANRPIALAQGRTVTLGTEIAPNAAHFELHAAGVSLRHAMIARQKSPGPQGEPSQYWLIDCQSENGTFVNRQSVVVHPLESGDLIQVGPFGWIFSSEEGVLVPVAGIDGVGVHFQAVRIKAHANNSATDRLAKLKLHVSPGEMIAVTGPSGAGKSTVIKAIMQGSSLCTEGDVFVDGRSVSDDREFFRSVVGYVSQEQVVHADLTARQAVEFSAQLREKPADSTAIDDILRQVDLPEGTWSKIPKERSGGESKRVRVATELIAKPRLLLLDEPGSGLDRDREAILMRLLRGLSFRGCTVIVVTHNLAHLKTFDRVLLFHEGRLRFDGSPEELQAETQSGDLESLDFHCIEQDCLEGLPGNAGLGDTSRSHVTPTPAEDWRKRVGRVASQAQILFHREWTLVCNFPGRRLAVPLILLPVFFAVSLHLAVGESYLMGFLAILSCIWMGASLSLMSIVNERDVLEHERLLFLRLIPYIAAKSCMLWLLSTLQTIFFVALLMLLQKQSSEAQLLGPVWVAVTLLLTGWASVGTGMVISAGAGHNPALANFLVPLAMMLQIVFSIQVAGQRDADLHRAYDTFHSGRAAQVSYLTISRYADIALRSFSYWKRDYYAFAEPDSVEAQYAALDHERYGYGIWRRQSLSILFAIAVAGPLLTVVILRTWESLGMVARLRNPFGSSGKLIPQPAQDKANQP